MEQLARLRELKGFSQRALAKESGVSPATIYELENGRRRPNPSTLRKLAASLDVEVADLLGSDYPKEERRPPPEPSLFNGLEEARRLRPWITYVSRRVEWCEKVVGRTPADEWNNPWLSLDTAIQWAVYVGIENATLRNIITTEALPYAEALSNEADELRALLDRFRAVSTRTDERVKAMMDEAQMDEEEKRARFEVIQGQRSA